MAAWHRKVAALAGLGMMAAFGQPAVAGPQVEFDIPDGQEVSAEKMAKALLEALETAGPVERPLLLQALAAVLEMSPTQRIADAKADKSDSVY